jgi:hypothetical protein
VFRIVFNWRRQCPILAHSARCNSLIRRWPRGRLQLPKLGLSALEFSRLRFEEVLPARLYFGVQFQ